MPTKQSLVVLLLALLGAACVGALRIDSALFAPFIGITKKDFIDDDHTRAMLVLKGVAEGFVGGAVPDLETCVTDEEKVAQAASALATAFKAQQGDDVKKALGDLAQDLSVAFRPCQAADSEITRLMTALAAMQHPLAFSFQAGKNLAVNHVAIFSEVQDASQKWSAADFEGFGKDVGLALALVLDGAERAESTRPQFLEWALQHGKPYARAGLFRQDASYASAAASPELQAQRAEFELRLSAFTANLRVAAELSAADRGTATYGASPFADLTLEEFASTRLLQPIKLKGDDLAKSCLENGAILPPPPTVKAGAAPASFDWREKGAVTPVRDQGACGSCWAFSTAENIEGLWALAHKTLVELSPQDIVDCSKSCSPEGVYGNVCNSGCQGGWPWSAYLDIIKEGGIASEASYPYTGAAGDCAFKGKAEASATITNYTCLPPDESFMRDYLVSHGPLSVALDARFLMLYVGGISNPPMCSAEELDHAVLLVGYGSEEAPPPPPPKAGAAGAEGAEKPAGDAVDFWLVKNSWTENWGEKGYFRLARGSNVCGIANAASSAILSVPMTPLTPSGRGAALAPALAAAEEGAERALGAALSFAQRITSSLRKRVHGL